MPFLYPISFLASLLPFLPCIVDPGIKPHHRPFFDFPPRCDPCHPPLVVFVCNVFNIIITTVVRSIIIVGIHISIIIMINALVFYFLFFNVSLDFTAPSANNCEHFFLRIFQAADRCSHCSDLPSRDRHCVFTIVVSIVNHPSPCPMFIRDSSLLAI